MYSIVLMMAMTAPSDNVNWLRDRHSCNGGGYSCSGYSSGCCGYSNSCCGCNGGGRGGFLGLGLFHRHHGDCSGYNSCGCCGYNSCGCCGYHASCGCCGNYNPCCSCGYVSTCGCCGTTVGTMPPPAPTGVAPPVKMPEPPAKDINK